MADPARPTGVKEQIAVGAFLAAFVTVAARFTVEVLLTRSRSSVPVEVELACVVWLPIAVGTALAVLVDAPAPTILGALGVTPVGLAAVDGLIDRELARALPELAPTAQLMFVGCAATAWSFVTLCFVSVAVRALGRHAHVALAPVAFVVASLVFVAVVRAAITPAAPGLEVWGVFTEGLDSQLQSADVFARLDDDPTQFLDVVPPPFFARASVSRVPEVPEAPREEVDWPTPSGRTLVLGSHGLIGSRDLCFLDTGDLVVLLESSRGALVLRRRAQGGWRACGDVGTDWDGLRVSRATFETYGAPTACAWSLVLAALAGVVSLASAWRTRRSLADVERLVLAHVEDAERTTVRLVDGSLARVSTPIPTTLRAVLVAPPRGPLDYRDDARAPARAWVASEEGRVSLRDVLRSRLAAQSALAVFLMMWLALPALTAWQHGFVVSFG